MVSRSMVEEALTRVTNNDNRQRIEELFRIISGIRDDEWETFIDYHNITPDNLTDVINSKIATNRPLDEHLFESINDLVSYGVSGETLHLHVVPPDLKPMMSYGISKAFKLGNLKLIQALEETRNIVQMNETIQTVFAVSPLLSMRQLQKMFIALGFDVSKTTSEDLLRKFPDDKPVYQASLSRDKFLSREWEDTAKSISDSLKSIIGINERASSDTQKTNGEAITMAAMTKNALRGRNPATAQSVEDAENHRTDVLIMKDEEVIPEDE